jgi:hypothetical protein
MQDNITVESREIKLDDRVLVEWQNFIKNRNSIYNKSHEYFKSIFNIISVESVDDILRCDSLFEKLGVIVISNKDISLQLSKGFVIRDDEGWKLQSHYLGDGMNVDDLEKCVNYILKNN